MLAHVKNKCKERKETEFLGETRFLWKRKRFLSWLNFNLENYQESILGKEKRMKVLGISGSPIPINKSIVKKEKSVDLSSET